MAVATDRRRHRREREHDRAARAGEVVGDEAEDLVLAGQPPQPARRGGVGEGGGERSVDRHVRRVPGETVEHREVGTREFGGGHERAAAGVQHVVDTERLQVLGGRDGCDSELARHVVGYLEARGHEACRSGRRRQRDHRGERLAAVAQPLDLVVGDHHLRRARREVDRALDEGRPVAGEQADLGRCRLGVAQHDTTVEP